MNTDYEPFGEEWKRYMMRLSKAEILEIFQKIEGPKKERLNVEMISFYLAAQLGKTKKRTNPAPK